MSRFSSQYRDIFQQLNFIGSCAQMISDRLFYIFIYMFHPII